MTARERVDHVGRHQPSYTWLFDNKQSRFWRDWTTTHDKAAWDRYMEIADREHPSERRKTWESSI